MLMKLLVNNKETELTQGHIALHNRMVPRAEWENTVLNEGDSLVIIKAACGG